jgi:hypothetical protein
MIDCPVTEDKHFMKVLQKYSEGTLQAYHTNFQMYNK